MKNTENAAMPMSAIVYRPFWPRRQSGRPAQVSRNPSIKPSIVSTESLNQPRGDSNTKKMHADSICRTPPTSQISKMRIAEG
jgi:hypothetical protein